MARGQGPKDFIKWPKSKQDSYCDGLDPQFLSDNANHVCNISRNGTVKPVINLQSKPSQVSKQEYVPLDYDLEIPEDLKLKISRKGPYQGGKVELTKDEYEILLMSGKFALVSPGPNHVEMEQYHDDPSRLETITELRKRDLETKLVSQGFMYSEATGIYEGNKEPSYLIMIHDVDVDFLKDVGQELKQDSVIYSCKGKQIWIENVADTYDGENETYCFTGEGYEDFTEAPNNQFYSEIKTADNQFFRFSLNFLMDFGDKSKFRFKFDEIKGKDTLGIIETANSKLKDFLS